MLRGSLKKRSVYKILNRNHGGILKNMGDRWSLFIYDRSEFSLGIVDELEIPHFGKIPTHRLDVKDFLRPRMVFKTFPVSNFPYIPALGLITITRNNNAVFFQFN